MSGAGCLGLTGLIGPIRPTGLIGLIEDVPGNLTEEEDKQRLKEEENKAGYIEKAKHIGPEKERTTT